MSMFGRLVKRCLHAAPVALRKDTEFVIKRRAWRKEMTEFRKSVAHMQEEVGGRLDKLGQRKDRRKAQLRAQRQQAASSDAPQQKEQNQAKSEPMSPEQAKLQALKKQRQQFHDSMVKVQKDLKQIKIAQGVEKYKATIDEDQKEVATIVKKKMEERASYLTYDDDLELEKHLTTLVNDEVAYDFHIDSTRTTQSRKIASMLDNFGSVFERSNIVDTTPLKQ